MENIKIVMTMRKEKGSEELGAQIVLEIPMSEAEKINEMMVDKKYEELKNIFNHLTDTENKEHVIDIDDVMMLEFRQ
jgi:hypothetical protein